MKKIIALLIIGLPLFSAADNKQDTIPGSNYIVASQRSVYYENNGDSFICNKPRLLDFVTHISRDGLGYVRHSFEKKNLYKTGIVVASTALLIGFDQQITNQVQNFARRNGIASNEQFSTIASVKLFGKKTVLGKWPLNANTAFYDLGQGSSVIYIAAGFYFIGRIKKDNRALQTASQLAEAFLTLGISTQFLKYVSGRENPTDASVPGGRWRPFPSFGNFQNNKTKFDAFPSGHLATFVSAVTIISENYPTVKWIKPVGFTISALLGFAMLNNGVHWAGDYPLGCAMGYGFGKFIARKSHLKLKPAAF